MTRDGKGNLRQHLDHGSDESSKRQNGYGICDETNKDSINCSATPLLESIAYPIIGWAGVVAMRSMAFSS